MRLSLMSIATSAAVGAGDIGAEELDAKQGYSKPFENATDILRTVEVLGGAAANYARLEEKYTDTVVYASLPLWMKSLYRAAVQAMGGSTTVRRGGTATKAVTVRVAPSSGIQPVAGPGGNFRSISA